MQLPPLSFPEAPFFLLQSSLSVLVSKLCFCEKCILQLRNYQHKTPVARELVYPAPDTANLCCKRPLHPSPLFPEGLQSPFVSSITAQRGGGYSSKGQRMSTLLGQLLCSGGTDRPTLMGLFCFSRITHTHTHSHSHGASGPACFRVGEIREAKYRVRACVHMYSPELDLEESTQTYNVFALNFFP